MIEFRKCPHCGSHRIIKRGHNYEGKVQKIVQIYQCKDCKRKMRHPRIVKIPSNLSSRR